MPFAMAALVTLQTLPPEVFDLVIEQLLPTIGIFKALRLRATSRAFNSAILQAICVTQVIDTCDPALEHLLDSMDPKLRGKIIATQSISARNAAGRKTYVSIVAKMTHALQTLTNETDDAIVRRWRESIAEVVNVHPREHLANQSDAQNLLCAAATLGDVSILKLLMEGEKSGSADVNGLTTFFDQPLTLAAAGGHVDAVHYLLNNGARLHSAPIPVVRGFVQADYNKMDLRLRRLVLGHRRPRTGLRTAVLGGHTDVVRLLLQPEHRLETGSLEYLRAMMAAASAGRLDLAEAILEATGQDWFSFDWLRFEPEGLSLRSFMMWKAVAHDRVEFAEFLLSTGIDVNAFRDRFGSYRGTLEHAAVKGHVRMVRFLIERGADVELGGVSNRFPGRQAAECGQEEVVDLLIQHGANPVHAFRGAAAGGQVRLLDHLLRRFPDLPDREGGEVGRKALISALSTGLATITRLVEAGVSLNDGWKPVNLPLDVAKKSYGLWVVNHLRALGAKETDEDTRIFDENDPLGQRRIRSITVSERTWTWLGRY